MAGYRSGKFPNGAVIVFDMLDVTDTDNAVTEGPRNRGRHAQGFEALRGDRRLGLLEGFKGDSRERAVGSNASAACYQCHTSQKDRDYVFSSWRP